MMFFYQNIPSRAEHPFDRMASAMAQQTKQSTPCSLVSNELLVTVTD
jgi:hypothetical protein